MLSISVREASRGDPDVSVQHIHDEGIKGEVCGLVENYYPAKTKDTGVTTKIALQDDVPMSQNPRRLSAEQNRIVTETIDRWISENVDLRCFQRGISKMDFSMYSLLKRV